VPAGAYQIEIQQHRQAAENHGMFIRLSEEAGQDANQWIRYKLQEDAQHEADKHKPVPLHCILRQGHPVKEHFLLNE